MPWWSVGGNMEILELMMMSLQFTAIFARRRHKNSERHSSAESIENLLYFKDCKQKHNTAPPAMRAAPVAEPPRPPACPCPRMCCSMCCDCGVPEGPQSFISRQMAPLQMPSFEPSPPEMNMPLNMPMTPNMHSRSPVAVQPQIVRKRKKMKLMMPSNVQRNGQPMMQPPARRALGFTRENIKSLISKDQDIKKILKDLVRVTMNKVDLVGAVSSKRNMMTSTEAPEAEAITDPPTTDDEDFIEEF